ncbi:MAG: hypothetical protein AAGG44_13310 [Planctomycetota bacterium]
MSSDADANYEQTYHRAKWRRTAILVAVVAGTFTFAISHRRNEGESDVVIEKTVDQTESAGHSADALVSRIKRLKEATQQSIQFTAELSRLESILNEADADTVSALSSDLTSVLEGLEQTLVSPTVPNRKSVETLSTLVQKKLSERLERDRDYEEQLVLKAREDATADTSLKLARATAKLQAEIELQASLERQLVAQQVASRQLAARASRVKALRQDRAEIDALLKPFTSPGHYQPSSRTNAWDMEWNVVATPVSLSRLHDLGALDDTPSGLQALYVVGGAKAPGASHDRPLGEFPQCWAGHLRKPEVRDAVSRAQELLRVHGKALVEQGLLAP